MTTATAAPATKWAREYETIYILRPDVDNDVAEKVIDRARDVIKRLDGTLTKLDNWGKRKLAYPIQKNTRGIFVYLKYVGFSDLVAELERNLGLLDEVVRFQTVLVQEDVDPASIAVDPDEVQYLHVEEEEEAEDAELERARSLGMAPRAPRETSDEQGSDDDSDMSGSDDEDGDDTDTSNDDDNGDNGDNDDDDDDSRED